MADAKLLRLWAAVRQDFDQARSLLPSPPIEAEGSVSRLVEWLDHNELGLALDELEALGNDNTMSSEYWRVLSAAAERMGLSARRARLTSRGGAVGDSTV